MTMRVGAACGGEETSKKEQSKMTTTEGGPVVMWRKNNQGAIKQVQQQRTQRLKQHDNHRCSHGGEKTSKEQTNRCTTATTIQRTMNK
jgi:hypothetical protein